MVKSTNHRWLGYLEVITRFFARVRQAGSWYGGRFLFENQAHSAYTQVQASSRQNLSNLRFPKHRTEHLQTLDDVADEFGPFIDRLPQLNKGLGALLIDTL